MARNDIDILQAPVKRFVTVDWADGGDTVTGAKWNHVTTTNATFSIGALSTRAMTVTTAGADNDGAQFQSAPFFRLAAGIKWYAKGKLTPSEATQSDFWFGFANIDTDITSTLPIDHFLFLKNDADTDIGCHVSAASTTTGTDSTIDTAVAATQRTYEVKVEGLSATSAKVEFYIDGVLVHSATTTGHTANQRFAFSFGYLAGAASAQTCEFQSLYAYCDEQFV